MLKKITGIIAILIVLGGAVLMCYPSFANLINKQFDSNQISEYNDQINSLTDQNIEEELELAKAYNATLPASYPADPFTGQNVRDFTGTQFEDFSMVKQGEMLGYVEIPCIDVYLPVYYGVTEDVLQKGAGLVDNTSLPVGGEGTHAVISAHTGLASKKMFTDLTDVQEGDVFFIHVLNMDLAYQVDQIKVVLPEDTDDLLIEEGEDYVTLLTCTPFGINDHRLLVRGKRIDYDFASDNDSMTEAKDTKQDIYFWGLILGSCILAAVIIFLIYKLKRKKTREKEKGEK